MNIVLSLSRLLAVHSFIILKHSNAIGNTVSIILMGTTWSIPPHLRNPNLRQQRSTYDNYYTPPAPSRTFMFLSWLYNYNGDESSPIVYRCILRFSNVSKLCYILLIDRFTSRGSVKFVSPATTTAANSFDSASSRYCRSVRNSASVSFTLSLN